MPKQTAQIKCINKLDRNNPHERITHVGGNTPSLWKISQEDAIQKLEDSNGWSFWVSVRGQSTWVVVGVSRYGNKYLKTQDDGEDQNNLLSLPECPG